MEHPDYGPDAITMCKCRFVDVALNLHSEMIEEGINQLLVHVVSSVRSFATSLDGRCVAEN